VHRSGTSALVQLLAALGLAAGDADVLMDAHESNPTGHWEVTRLTELNDRLLHELGGRWSGPPPLDPEALRELAAGPWGDEARQAFESVLPNERWVWKDPRTCLLAPFWRAVLGDEGLSAVVILRSPHEVAGSLHARDGIDEGYGLLLWERYQRGALAAGVGLPGHVLTYDDMLADPVGTARALQASLPDLAGAAIDEEALAAVVQPRHRHQQAEAEALPPSTSAVWEASLALRGGHPALPPVALPAEPPAAQAAFAEHHRLAAAEDALLQQGPLIEELHARRREVAELRSALESLESRAAVRAWRPLRRRPRPEISEVEPPSAP
jgi:hypothetical protein